MNPVINKAFKKFHHSKCMNTILSLVSDPRLSGSACSLYFELIKRIDSFGYCAVQKEVDFNNLSDLKNAGYIDFFIAKGISNIQFKFL